jgi:glycosyltransferase involved in cell wall biosynthesis
MKIAHIVPFFSGGVGNVISYLTKAFASLGHEVILLSPQKPPKDHKIARHYKLKEVRIEDPLYPLAFKFVNQKIIEEVVAVEKPDVIVTHGPLVIALSGVSGTPIISVVHGTYANEVRYMRYHPISGFDRIKYIASIYTTFKFDMALYNYMSRRHRNIYLVAVSKNTKRELVDTGVPSHRVLSILNGVDKDLFKPMNKDYAKVVVEEVFGVRLKNKVLLHVNPGPRKGTHMLIKALAMVEKVYGEDITLLVAGRMGPRSYREYVEAMVKGLGLENNVRFLGYVQDGKLPLLYNAADLTVVPSYSEGGPLITPESLACGTPVVATNVGGNPEYLALVNLNNLLVNIESYDFSRSLALKLIEEVKRDYRVNSTAVPSWHSTAKLYLNVAASLLSR